MESVKRCGHCKRFDDVAALCRVEKTNNGETKLSFAHPDCIEPWRKVSHIKIVGQSELDLYAIRVLGVENVVHNTSRHFVFKISSKANKHLRVQ